MQRFGEKLCRLRTHRGVIVRELAVALGYSATTNSYITETQTGKRRPKIDFALKVHCNSLIRYIEGVCNTPRYNVRYIAAHRFAACGRWIRQRNSMMNHSDNQRYATIYNA